MAEVDPSPIATTYLAGVDKRTANNPRGWEPHIFPNFVAGGGTSMPLATQRAVWLSDVKAYCLTTLFRNAAGVGSTRLLFWDGFGGQQFDPLNLNGEPGYYPPEVPQASKRDFTAFCRANGFVPGESIRPTERDENALTQNYGPDSFAIYRRKLDAAIADGCGVFWFDSAQPGTNGQAWNTGSGFFPAVDVAALAAEYPGVEMYFEWWSPDYAAIPNVLGYHDPVGGFLPFDQPDDPAWDAHAIYYDDERVDPRDPAQAAALAASYARGARLFLYVGANFDMATNGSYYTDDQRSDLYALWLANYPGAPAAPPAPAGEQGPVTSVFDAFFSDARSFLMGFHGDPTVLYAAGGSAAATVAVTAIVGAVAEEVIELPGDATRQLYRHRVLTVQTAQVPAPRRPDKAVIDGETWTVHERLPADGGLARLLIVRPVRIEGGGRGASR